jgi:hypothetical protein
MRLGVSWTVHAYHDKLRGLPPGVKVPVWNDKPPLPIRDERDKKWGLCYFTTAKLTSRCMCCDEKIYPGDRITCYFNPDTQSNVSVHRHHDRNELPGLPEWRGDK